MKFDKSQQRAILHRDGPMLVLAGPGSGKTAVITQRTKNLITEHKIPPENILVITFTKAAALEMKERFLKLTGEAQTKVTFGTFHAVFFMILKAAYQFDSSNIVREEQKYQFMREILSGYELEYKDENELIANLLGEISSVKNGGIALEYFYSCHCGEEIFREIYKKYERRLKQSRLVDFDDMLTFTYELFQARPDILNFWQKRYPYILIDEFQDINRIQYEIIKLLSAPKNNLFVVGDDDQSIYRFRGSKPELMMYFKKDYPKASQILLEYNYRCGMYIVETAGNLISHNRQRFKKRILAVSKDRTPVRYALFEDQKKEYGYIICDLLDKVEKGACFSDAAVLFRTNTQSAALIGQLMEQNIPFKMKERMPNIYEHWIAKDILTYLRIAEGSKKRCDFLQIINRPKRYIGRDSLKKEQVVFEEWLQQFSEKPWIRERVEKLQEDLMLLRELSPYAAINYIRKGIGYEEYLVQYAADRGIQKGELLDILDEIQYSAKGYRRYEKWLRHIEDYGEQLKLQSEKQWRKKDAVTLATLHGAKGLEFEYVYLVNVNEGVTPYKKAFLEKDIEEERRMFYVGMTRAKKQLSIFSVSSLNDKGAEVSRFVAESKKGTA